MTRQERFITKSNTVHLHKYDYSSVEYVNAHKKVIIICPDHGPFNQLPSNHIAGRGCQLCGHVSSATNKPKPNCVESFISVHMDRYDYSLVNYTGFNDKVVIVCKVHGEFTQTPSAHTKGQGCPTCGIEQRKLTKLIKYGDSNYNNRPQYTQTNLLRYGVEYPIQHNEIQEKIKQTNLYKYGVDNPRKSEEIKTKIKQTNNDRYGNISFIASPTGQSQSKLTSLNKYGTNYFSQKHMIDIIDNINCYDYMYNEYITLRKPTAVIASEMGVDGTTICTYLKTLGIDARKEQHSYVSKMWMESLMTLNNITIDYEVRIPGTRYRADGFCQETNTIYEFHGDYWHGNPSVYEQDVYNVQAHQYMGILYQKTIEREDVIISLGYNLIVMWERDWVKQSRE